MRRSACLRSANGAKTTKSSSVKLPKLRSSNKNTGPKHIDCNSNGDGDDKCNQKFISLVGECVQLGAPLLFSRCIPPTPLRNGFFGIVWPTDEIDALCASCFPWFARALLLIWGICYFQVFDTYGNMEKKFAKMHENIKFALVGAWTQTQRSQGCDGDKKLIPKFNISVFINLCRFFFSFQLKWPKKPFFKNAFGSREDCFQTVLKVMIGSRLSQQSIWPIFLCHFCLLFHSFIYVYSY